ncbi:MAG TPA: ABC transporter ATP-binding protein [Firmicutes bacterium]|nr:ABC transporter ATP-binding protein [Bacillota bacterium]
MRGGFGGRLQNDKEENYSLRHFNRKALKLLFRHLRPHWKTLTLASLAMLAVTFATLAAPYLSKIAVDDFILPGDLSGLNMILLLLLLVHGLFWLSSFLQTYLSGRIGHIIVAQVRKELYRHIIGMPMSFFKKRLTGELMSRITHDVNALSELISSGFIYFFNDLLTLAGIITIMICLKPSLALVSFLVIPFIFFSISLLGKQMRSAYRDVREKLARLNADVEENLSGIRLVQALNREAVNTGKFKTLSWQNLKANLKAVSYFALLFPTMNLSRVLGEVLVLTYGGWLVIRGNITLGIVIAFLGYVRQFFAPLADLSQVYNTYQGAAAALERIDEYLSLKPEIREKTNPVLLKEERRGEISFQHIRFSYNGEEVIKDVHLHIPSCETLALVGPTGAGKTTLVNLLTRLYDVKEGSILIDSTDIRDLSLNSLRSLISVVPQNIFLFDTTVKENIRYGNPDATDEEVVTAAQQVNAHDFISRFPLGYETEVGEGGIRLSGGQKQLISFARALISRPDIIILDEATSSVDSYTELLIQQALTELLKGRTSLIIAHRFTTLERAHRIAVLNQGVIEAVGSHKTLMKENHLYKGLYQKQLLGKGST